MFNQWVPVQAVDEREFFIAVFQISQQRITLAKVEKVVPVGWEKSGVGTQHDSVTPTGPSEEARRTVYSTTLTIGCVDSVR